MKLRAGEWLVLAGTVVICAFAALVGTLIYLKPPPAEYLYTQSAAAQLGEAIYRRESCRDCHKVLAAGSSSGPRLDGIGARRTRAWLEAYLSDLRPQPADPAYRVRMPSYAGLPEEERLALVAYLFALGGLQ